MGLLVCFILLARVLLSEGSICLTWRLHENSLMFRCQTSQINARISFFDQYNHEQAYCVLPYQSTFCISYNHNRKIYQNLTSKETFLEIRENIGQHLDGQWGCHYGRNLEIGYTDVKIIKDKVFQFTGKYIRINGASMIKTGGPLWLSCFSNIPFMVSKVQFYANDNLYITLNKDIYGCRSSADNDICEPDQCHCSEDGKTYFVKHQGFPMAGNVSLQCKMEFELAFEMADCIIVNAIDLDKPKIIQDKKQPLFASDQVKSVCYAFVKTTNLQLFWDCFNMTPISTSRNETIITSTISFHVTSSMNNKICTCKVSYRKLERSTSLTIIVSKAPILSVIHMFVCNQSTTVSIVCNGESGLSMIHFRSWIHLYNRNFIRFINGTHDLSSSTIKFDKCNFEDEGEYVCQAHSSEQGLVFLSNTSTKVVVEGPPFLSSTDIFEGTSFIISVKMYSANQPINIEWFVGKDKVKNSTRFAQMLVTTTIQREMHGKTISAIGYKASLRMTNYSIEVVPTISILVENEFGNMTKMFVINKKKLTMKANLDLRYILYAIFGVVILIIMITITLVLNKYRYGRNNTVRSIYFAAPPPELNAHRYDLSEHISQYEEIEDIPNEELNVIQQNDLEEDDKDDTEEVNEGENESENEYQIPHDYIEVL